MRCQSVGAAGAMLLAVIAPVRAQPAPAVDWSTAQPVSLLLIDDRFVPDRLVFRHAVPYRLHVENRGRNLHEFTAPGFLAASVVRNPAQLANGGREIVVQPGTTVDVELMPLNPGSYELICADHDWAGMMGDIVVE